MKTKLKGRASFLRERTRYLLAHVWCVDAIETGKMKLRAANHPEHLYLNEAIERGWVSKKDRVTINQTGWEAGAAFLKR